MIVKLQKNGTIYSAILLSTGRLITIYGHAVPFSSDPGCVEIEEISSPVVSGDELIEIGQEFIRLGRELVHRRNAIMVKQ